MSPQSQSPQLSQTVLFSLHLEKILGEVHFLKTDNCELTTNVATKPIFAIVRAAAAATFAENYSEIAEFDEIAEICESLLLFLSLLIAES